MLLLSLHSLFNFLCFYTNFTVVLWQKAVQHHFWVTVLIQILMFMVINHCCQDLCYAAVAGRDVAGSCCEESFVGEENREAGRDGGENQ